MKQDFDKFFMSVSSDWKCFYAPSTPDRFVLTKEKAIVEIQVFSTKGANTEDALDDFYLMHVEALGATARHLAYDEDDTYYEILSGNEDAFEKFFFRIVGDLICRAHLHGFWWPDDEVNVRAMLDTLVEGVTEKVTEELFESINLWVNYEKWDKVGMVYSKPVENQ
jgi:hypothetical protein